MFCYVSKCLIDDPNFSSEEKNAFTKWKEVKNIYYLCLLFSSSSKIKIQLGKFFIFQISFFAN